MSDTFNATDEIECTLEMTDPVTGVYTDPGQLAFTTLFVPIDNSGNVSTVDILGNSNSKIIKLAVGSYQISFSTDSSPYLVGGILNYQWFARSGNGKPAQGTTGEALVINPLPTSNPFL